MKDSPAETCKFKYQTLGLETIKNVAPEMGIKGIQYMGIPPKSNFAVMGNNYD